MYEPQTADLTRRGASPGTTAQALPLQVVTTSRPSRTQRSTHELIHGGLESGAVRA